MFFVPKKYRGMTPALKVISIVGRIRVTHKATCGDEEYIMNTGGTDIEGLMMRLNDNH